MSKGEGNTQNANFSQFKYRVDPLKLRSCLRNPFLRMPMGVPFWNEQEIKFILKNYLKNHFDFEGVVERLEEQICSKLNVKFCIATNSGREAIELALKALGLKEGDGVILPSFLCLSALMPILRIGCQPQFVDIDENFNISPESVIQNITSNTRAILMPHLFGRPAQISAILEIVHKNGLFLIDDAAQSIGAKWNDKFTGTIGNFGILSFGPFKGLVATKGGFLITNDEDLFKRVKRIPLLENSNREAIKRAVKILIKLKYRRYTYSIFLLYRLFKQQEDVMQEYINNKISVIKKMSDFDAKLIEFQLQKLTEIIDKRRDYAKKLHSYLSDIDSLKLPELTDAHTFVNFVIELPKGDYLDKFLEFMWCNGIEANRTYIPLHLQKQFAHYSPRPLPRTEAVWMNLAVIPINPSMQESDVEYIGLCIRKFMNLYV